MVLSFSSDRPQLFVHFWLGSLPGRGFFFLILGSGFSIFITFLESGLALSEGSPNRFWYEFAERKMFEFF